MGGFVPMGLARVLSGEEVRRPLFYCTRRCLAALSKVARERAAREKAAREKVAREKVAREKVAREIVAAAFQMVAVLLMLAVAGCGGRELETGAIVGGSRSEASIATARARQVSIDGDASPILFGDLHVHTAYSIDAYVFALPPFGGEGARPPADACDFARYCAAVDFFALTDHAEAMTHSRWRASKQSVRACNALSSDPTDPDLVAFVGYEWTQAGSTAANHYGHKNVIFQGLADDELPSRVITALPDGTIDRARGMGAMAVLELFPRIGLGAYGDFLWWMRQMAGTPDCASGIDSRELPADCRENAETPDVLFEKLAQQGHDPLVIPHGLAWGVHAPPGSTIENQLTRAAHDGERQRLIEVYSGHGSSEEFRDVPEFVEGEEGGQICPAPTDDYLACCWRAGEIVRARCGDLAATECDARVEEAKRLALVAGVSPHLVLPDTRPEDWLDCDQCRDCFKPAMNLRPGETAQYASALSNFEESDAEGSPLRFRFGFIASSDDHRSRPGTGYKQFARRQMTDARGMVSPFWDGLMRPYTWGRQRDRQRAQPAPVEERGLRGLLDVERGASFMYPGGLVAVHSRDRSRGAIWEALEARQVYATSGPRILLWFDLVNAPGGPAPMGAQVSFGEAPRFEVRAAGSFVQQPGCPEESLRALGADRLELLCRGECYQPSDERRILEAIEVVRIRPQAHAGEPVAPLIEDPWRRLPCDPDPAGCRVTFEDADFVSSRRDAVYYVRAIEAPSLAVNGANQRAQRDAQGNIVATEPCHGGYRTPLDDDCLAPVRERAWSSPIYVDQP
jgi:hypothetical protein